MHLWHAQRRSRLLPTRHASAEVFSTLKGEIPADLRSTQDTTSNGVVPLFLYDIGVTLEKDVGPILVERAIDADAFVADFIKEATRTEPTTRFKGSVAACCS